jgi:hypothetical protein
MKDLRKWRFKFVVIALVVGGFLGWMALQQTSPAEAAQEVQKLKPGLQMLPASAKEPPEMAKLKDTKAVPTKARTRPTRDALLQKVAKQKEGQDKVQRAKAKQKGKTVLRAASKEPPEMAKLKDTKAVPTKARTRPSRNALLQKVLKQPGGKEKIQKANPKGLKLGAGWDTTGWSLPSLSSLNPFTAGVAHASDATTLVLTPQYPYKSSPFWGVMCIFGELGGYYNTYPGRARFYNYYNSSLGTRIYKPLAYVKINAPSSGWYLFNFETYNGAKATLKHSVSGSGYVTVQTWDERSHTGWTDHPALINLSAGYHYFYWTVEPGSSFYVYLYRVSIEKM